MTTRWKKIWALGDRNTQGIFEDECEWSEKIDGSQCNWGIDPKYGLQMLSKGAEFRLGDGNKLFDPAAIHITTLSERNKLKEGWSYHAETLANPGHNSLVYDRVPKNHLALYGVTKDDGTLISDRNELESIAADLDIDVVPCLFLGKVEPQNALAKINELLERESYLGKAKIEGVVIKNHNKHVFIFGSDHLVQAKYVGEAFKEIHKVAWPANNKAPIQVIGEMVRTDARWTKARQHVAEDGIDVNTVQAIGPIIKYLHEDMKTEDADTIKNMLFSAFIKDLQRVAVRGYPEFHKQKMIKPELTLEEFDKGQKTVDVFLECETRIKM